MVIFHLFHIKNTFLRWQTITYFQSISTIKQFFTDCQTNTITATNKYYLFIVIFHNPHP